MDDTYFIVVDLEIKSRSDLSPIVDSFGDDAIVMYSGKWGRFYLAAFEISAEGGANENIKLFCRLIECLDEEAKKLWDESYSKIFDVGFQCGGDKSSHRTIIEQSVIQAVSSLGATIGVTIYPNK